MNDFEVTAIHHSTDYRGDHTAETAEIVELRHPGETVRGLASRLIRPLQQSDSHNPFLDRIEIKIVKRMGFLERTELSDTSAHPDDEWNPIETAPRDGRPVMLHWKDPVVVPEARCDIVDTFLAQWKPYPEGSGKKGLWICAAPGVMGDIVCPFEPTHWRPMPVTPRHPA